MIRVRFLVHVMGAPGPVACYNEGQVAEIPPGLYAVFEAKWGEDRPWVEEYDGDVEECPHCKNEFVSGGPVIRHREWAHGEHLASIVRERKNRQYAKGDGDLICINCTRRFDMVASLKHHRTTMHLEGAEPAHRSGGKEEAGEGHINHSDSLTRNASASEAR